MSRKKQKKTLEELLEEALVPEEEQPYQVPENWVWVRFEQALENVTDSSRKVKQKDYLSSGSIPVIDQGAEMIGGYTNQEELCHPAPLPVIIFGDHTKCVKWVDFEFAQGADGVKVLKNRKAFDPKFLYYYLTSLKLPDKGYSRHFKYLKQSKIPLPPLPEQKRIVARVESLLGKINEAKELIKEAKETFESRRSAILAKAFRGELTKKWREQHPDIEPADQLLERIKAEKEKLEETKKRRKQKTELPPIDPPYELPKGWKWVRLGDITTINPGKPKNMELPQDHQCSFVPMAAIDGFKGIISNIQQRRFDEVKNGYTYFEENDILFAKITPCMENGKVALAKGLFNQFGFGTTEFHVIRCHPLIHPKYIYHLVRSDSFRKRAKAAMTGAVGQQRVPKNFLETYPCPLPPFKEQKVIADHLDALLSYEYDFQTILDREDDIMTLTQSILNKAFRGELGTNDPEEESALELLKEVLLEQAGETIDNPKSKANRQGSLLLV